MRVTPCSELYAVERPNRAETAILDLSVVLHRRMYPDVRVRPSAIAYHTQIVAYSFFDQFGLDETVAEIAKG